MFQRNRQSLTDSDLVSLAQQGDDEAFEILLERHLQNVYNRVRYKVPERDVDDVTQEVFISAVKSLNSFDGDSKFSTWLRTLTNRRIADYYRSRNAGVDDETTSQELGEDIRPSYSGLRASKSVDVIDSQIVLQDALVTLPEHYQEVILLRFAEGLKFKDIADEIDKSLAATKSLYRRAIDALRDELE